MRLKHLSLNVIVDVAFICGIDRTPVSILIATPPGAGKTWATKSIELINGVKYLSHSTSPNEHRKLITHEAPRIRLLINDDAGQLFSSNRREQFLTTFSSVIDGRIAYTVYKTGHYAYTNCSLILCCTQSQYYDVQEDMERSGLHSRLIPFVVGTSEETRINYQERLLLGKIESENIPNRQPVLYPRDLPKDDIIRESDVEPRLLKNIRVMSQYLTEEQTDELIKVAHSKGSEYEI